MRKPSRTNFVLLALIGMLGIVLVSRGPASPASLTSAALAQPQPTTQPPFNSADERKQMVMQLEQINKRLTNIETKLNSGISVKVTEMPAITIKDKPGAK